MKYPVTLLLLIFTSICVFSQKSPIINIGVGLPLSYRNINYSYSGGEVYFDNDRIYLFAEKPELFEIIKSSNLFVSPGAAFIRLSEKEGSGALGGSASKDYTRSALSIYSKFIFKTQFVIKNMDWYGGLTTGFYLYTHQSGTREWTYYYGEKYHNHGTENIDGDSKSFFKTFYSGILAGFRFNFQTFDFLHPAIEFAFYPEYANIFDSYSGAPSKDVSKSLWVGTIVLGFGTKKATQSE